MPSETITSPLVRLMQRMKSSSLTPIVSDPPTAAIVVIASAPITIRVIEARTATTCEMSTSHRVAGEVTLILAT